MEHQQQRTMQSAASAFATGLGVAAFQPATQQRQRVQLRVVAKDSRIGKVPVPVPAKVTVAIDGQTVTVKVSVWAAGRAQCASGWPRGQAGSCRKPSRRQPPCSPVCMVVVGGHALGACMHVHRAPWVLGVLCRAPRASCSALSTLW